MYKKSFIKIASLALALCASSLTLSFGMSDFAKTVLGKKESLETVLEKEASFLRENKICFCGCIKAPYAQRLVLFERLAQDVEKKYADKSMPIVVTNFAEEKGFDSGLAIYTLLYSGYKDITINLVGKGSGPCSAVKKLAYLIKQDLGANTKIIDKKNVCEIHNIDEKIRITLVGIENGFDEYAAGLRDGKYQKSHVYTYIDISSSHLYVGNRSHLPIPLKKEQLKSDKTIVRDVNTIELVSNALKKYFSKSGEIVSVQTNKVPHYVSIRIARAGAMQVNLYQQVELSCGNTKRFCYEKVFDTSDIVDFEKIYGAIFKGVQALVIELENLFKAHGNIYKYMPKGDLVSRLFALTEKYKFSFLALQDVAYCAHEDFRDCVAFTKANNDPLIYELNTGTVKKHEKEYSFPK